MKTHDKEEIKKLIKEVIEERWKDIFKRKDHESEQKYELFTDVEKWMNEMLDDSGMYVGPKLDYPFTFGNYIQDPSEIKYSTLERMMNWNEIYGRKLELSFRDINLTNKIARNNFERDHYEAILGYFPNEQ